jgi:hypothetical protein
VASGRLSGQKSSYNSQGQPRCANARSVAHQANETPWASGRSRE